MLQNETIFEEEKKQQNEFCSICLSISLEVTPRVRSAILSVCAPLQYWQTENSILKRCMFAGFDKLQSSKDCLLPLFHLDIDIRHGQWTFGQGSGWVGGVWGGKFMAK